MGRGRPRPPAKDRSALIAVLSDAEQDFATAAAEEAEAAAEALHDYDERHAQGQALDSLPAGEDAVGEGQRAYVRRHYSYWARADMAPSAKRDYPRPSSWGGG